MKRSILTLLLSSLLWVACDRDDTPHEFVDNRLIEIIDDGNTHTWMRLANATGRPMCIVYLRPGDDIPEICPCPPWHTVVCHVAAEEEAAPAAAFQSILRLGSDGRGHKHELLRFRPVDAQSRSGRCVAVDTQGAGRNECRADIRIRRRGLRSGLPQGQATLGALRRCGRRPMPYRPPNRCSPMPTERPT